MNGNRKETNPMLRLAFQCRRSVTGSISAPARNVSIIEPMLARKVVSCVWWSRLDAWGRFPTIPPTTISTSATDTPMRMLISEAASAIATQTNAIQYTFTARSSPPASGPEGVLHQGSLAGRSHQPGWAVQGAGFIAPFSTNRMLRRRCGRPSDQREASGT
jgi:hypothetical protein